MEEIENNIQEDITYIRENMLPFADVEPVDRVENAINSMLTYIYAEKENLENLVAEINGEQ